MDEQKKQELENGVNQGVVAPTQDEEKASGVLDIGQFPVTAQDSNQDPFLSDFDSQRLTSFDTLGCNVFSSVGSVEMFLNALGGDPDYAEGGKVELSERFACVEAGLNGSQGSSQAQWEEALARKGLVRHQDWPWDALMTKDVFFEAIDPAIEAKGAKFLLKYTPFHRPVGLDKASLVEALKYGPVKIFIGTGAGWNQGEPNVIPKTSNPMGHAVLLRKITDQGYHIRDQYDPYLKILAPDYVIYYAFQTLFKKQAAFSHFFSKNLQYGDTDSECIMLQMALSRDGEFPPDVPYNMHFGWNTLQAVQKFQVKYGIVQPGGLGYGRCGPRTRYQLNQLFAS